MLVLKVYDGVLKAGKYLPSKRKVQHYFFTMATMMFIMGGVLNVFAQTPIDTPCLDLTTGYQGENDVSNALTEDLGLDADNVNVNSVLGPVSKLTQVFILDEFCNHDDVVNNAQIPSTMKHGLLHVIDNNTVAMYENYPQSNVYAHLQDQWIPGESADSAIYAQDGYDQLVATGIDQLWEKTSVIAYMLFVIVLIIAGFMIMFRQKIGGQLAVSIFNTIPQVIWGLILVAFSFSIVGIMMNLGALAVNIIASILGFSSASDGIVVSGPLSVFWGLVTGSTGFAITNLVAGGGIVTLITLAFTGIGASIATGPIGLGVAAAGGLLLFLVALLVIGIVLVASFKVYFVLVKAYISILIDTVMAPLIIAISVAPGQAGLRSDLFRRLAKNILTFPGVYLMLNLASYIFNSSFDFAFPSGLAGGDITAVASGGISSGLVLALIKAAVTIYLFYLAAEVPKVLEDFLPSNSGKGTQAALQGAAKGAFGRIPIIGGLIG